MVLCYDCERPIRYWARSVRLEDGRTFHCSCRERLEFFRRSLDLLPPPPESQRLKQPDQPNPLADYEVAIVEEESRGLILVWDFGWASRRYGNDHVQTDRVRHDAGHSIHRLGGVTIVPLPRDARSQSSDKEPIVLLPQWKV
jgi:hypothetical protein